MVSEMKALQEWTNGETHQIKEEILLTQNKFKDLNKNLSAEANSIGQIQDSLFELDKELMTFRNRAQNLSHKLEALKKKIHSAS